MHPHGSEIRGVPFIDSAVGSAVIALLRTVHNHIKEHNVRRHLRILSKFFFRKIEEIQKYGKYLQPVASGIKLSPSPLCAEPDKILQESAVFLEDLARGHAILFKIGVRIF